MRLRNFLLIVGILALVAGITLSGIWFSRSPGHDDAQHRTAQNDAVLVAAHPIATGLLLRPEDMRWKEVASNELSPAYLVRGRVSETDYVGAVARRDLVEGEAITAAALVKPEERGFLAAALAPGTRAVTIVVGAPQSASGMLLPGDHVDIILTQRLDNADASPARSVVGETVLHDLRLIAVDQKLTTAMDAAPASHLATPGNLPKTITLEVSSEDAEKLLVAAELGNVGVAVRPLENAAQPNAEQSKPIWAADVSPALAAIGRTGSVAVSAGADRTSAYPVQVIHGAKIDDD